LFIICTFLFAPFSVRGQVQDDIPPLEKALQWERVVYLSDDPSETHSALIAKAECYSLASMPGEAFRTLERIRMYLLDSGTAAKVQLLKARYSKDAGDMGAALGYLEESGGAGDYPAMYSVLLAYSWRLEESKEQALRAASSEAEREAVIRAFKKAPKLKKEGTAAVLSFIPPAGQFYLNKPWAGILSLCLNAGAAGFTVVELLGRDWVTGLLGGGLLLNETFFKGNMERNLSSVDDVNNRSINEFSQSLESLLSSFQTGRP